jgi:hypothetical protein
MEKKLPTEGAIFGVLNFLIDLKRLYHPDNTKVLRDQQKEMDAINDDIVKLSSKLIEKMGQRKELSNHSGVTCNYIYSIGDLIESASENHVLYKSYVQEKARPLFGQYDLKYWPSVEELIIAIKNNADKALVYCHDDASTYATNSKKYSPRADFVRAFLKSQDDIRLYHMDIPQDFEFTNSEMADITNCLLGYDDLINTDYVKRRKQEHKKSFNT